MNSCKSVLFSVFLILIFFCASAQTDIIMETNLVGYNKKENLVELSLKFTTESDSSILFYKPTIEDICYGLVFINFQEPKSSSVYSLFPCLFRADLSHIILTGSNSIFINRNNEYETVLKLDISNVPDKIKKGCFEIIVSLNYSYGNFVSDNKRVFKGLLSSKNKIM